jgi:putative sigma-54 modulation protein
MQISTTARHCELKPGIRDFAERRLGRLQRLARDLQEAHLIVTAEKYRHTAEITVKLKHHEMVSREQSTDVHAAIDRAADQLEEQLRRLKDRRLDHRRVPGEEPAPESNGEPSAEASAGAFLPVEED